MTRNSVSMENCSIEVELHKLFMHTLQEFLIMFSSPTLSATTWQAVFSVADGEIDRFDLVLGSSVEDTVVVSDSFVIDSDLTVVVVGELSVVVSVAMVVEVSGSKVVVVVGAAPVVDSGLMVVVSGCKVVVSGAPAVVVSVTGSKVVVSGVPTVVDSGLLVVVTGSKVVVSGAVVVVNSGASSVVASLPTVVVSGATVVVVTVDSVVVVAPETVVVSGSPEPDSVVVSCDSVVSVPLVGSVVDTGSGSGVVITSGPQDSLVIFEISEQLSPSQTSVLANY
ncbi:hypothetical protein FF38_03932 [Lucilia cuprina]|uniref:Uncharacterized protein n=1 Tax=Lucilia cuprina TaxID=7375 RepID=A0A0L0CDI9_LUCCU|nr:hypothetical protein FF38_03932 [Lucilia cuprina]